MSLQDNNPKNPLDGGLDELKQQAISTAENKIAGAVSEKLNNPIVNKVVENKDTIIKAAKNFSWIKDTEAPVNETFTGMSHSAVDTTNQVISKTFKDFLADKDSPLVYCTLTIDGKEFLAKNSYSVSLKQHTNDHDSFNITTPDDALDSFEGYVMENSKKLLGSNVVVNFHRYGEITQSFKGIIANIRNKKDDGGGYGTLSITGYAPSILLENGKDCQSFENKDLKGIVEDALKEYKGEVPIVADNLNTKYTIPYTVQYKESDYQFIKRLALRYGEYFYYDGEQLIFGNKVQPTIEVGENIDLINIEFEMMIKPQSFKYMAYDSISAEVKEKDSDSAKTQYKENNFQAIAVNASKQVFKKKAEMLFNATSQQNVESDLKEMVLRQKESREHLLQVRGKSRNPKLRIGGRAEISDINAKAMETYRIIAISHYHNGNEYYNEFLGIPDIFISPFFDEDAFPTCEEQSATVVQNDNPQGMIKIQFPWQKKKGLTTPWLRVVTPYAGKGKGMHIIPEVGEEVVVGFDNGNAERPFVFGAMFNGEASAGLGGAGNFMKGLQTPTGSRLHMNDKDGSLHMQDNGGVSMKFDGGGNASTIAKSNHHVNAGSKHATDVGKGASALSMDSDGVIDLSGKTKVTIKVGGSSIIIDGSSITISSGKVVVKGKSSIDLSSAKNHIGGETKLDGGDVFIN
ncbi:hypothetical protein GCM10023210_14100 [Chryseobacterium ginsengisoli]|uniref:Gp5/Type VI secretion system Vgr protein OB-fold domain-containing protein n=1 Tax=Chryseobacterium ginsengisoli TaxID=363853 RepID=A0ABP9M4Z7_9FLAO